LGALNLLAGREGLGKSTVAYWIAALVTHGRLEGFHFGKSKGVIIVATEDSFPKTIVPRLLAAGANLDRVFRVDVAESDGVIREILLPADVDSMPAVITENDAALVILDPLMSRIASGIDTHKDSDVRLALEPITRICEMTNATLLGVIHHNKTATDDPNSAVMGSRAFTAVARAVHSVVADPDDEAGVTRIFETTKNNLGRLDLPALTFTIEGVDIPTREGRAAKAGALVWGGVSELRARDAMRIGGKPSGKTDACERWLREYLTSQGGVSSKHSIVAAGAGAGYSERTIERASKKLLIHKRRDGSGGIWELVE
jgi:RecA-family ATPase